jgi:hypothetical protein
MGETASYLLAGVLLPPVSPLLIAAIALALGTRHRRSATLVAALALALDLACCLPVVAAGLARALEPAPLRLPPPGDAAAGACQRPAATRQRRSPERSRRCRGADDGAGPGR